MLDTKKRHSFRAALGIDASNFRRCLPISDALTRATNASLAAAAQPTPMEKYCLTFQGDICADANNANKRNETKRNETKQNDRRKEKQNLHEDLLLSNQKKTKMANCAIITTITTITITITYFNVSFPMCFLGSPSSPS